MCLLELFLADFQKKALSSMTHKLDSEALS